MLYGSRKLQQIELWRKILILLATLYRFPNVLRGRALKGQDIGENALNGFAHADRI
jgi:hypothetical protein